VTPDGGTPRRTIGQAVTGEVEPLGMTVDTKTAAKMLGVGYEALLDSLAAGAPPLAPIKVGHR
jgi:hypothetical protein